jgi:hypothetical protein
VNQELGRLNLAPIEPDCAKPEGCRPIM